MRRTGWREPQKSVFVLGMLLALASVVAGCSGEPRLSLHEAARRGDTNALHWYIDQGVDLNELKKGRRPLHLAAMNNHVQAAQLLLDAGADPNGKTATGEAPLVWAAGKGHEAMVRLLRRYGGRER
jgi:ankyrin repeat protein